MTVYDYKFYTHTAVMRRMVDYLQEEGARRGIEDATSIKCIHMKLLWVLDHTFVMPPGKRECVMRCMVAINAYIRQHI